MLFTPATGDNQHDKTNWPQTYGQPNSLKKTFPLTATEVPKDVVALFGEGDLVDRVSDVAGLQQVAGVPAGLPAVREAFHVVKEPVHHVRTWGGQRHITPIELARQAWQCWYILLNCPVISYFVTKIL